MKPAPPVRRHSLLKRALAANILLVGVSVMCLAALFFATQRSTLQGQLEARAALFAEFLASQSELSILVRNRPELERACVTALASEDLLYVVIIDASGDVLAEAARPGFPMTAIPARSAVRTANVSAAIFDGPPAYRKFIDVAKPVSTNAGTQMLDWEIPKATGATLGVVRVGFSMAKQRVLLVHTVSNGLVVAAVSLMLMLAVHYLQLRRILKPLNDLMGFTRKVAAGDLKQRAPLSSLEEISDLGVAFNDMVAELDLTADLGIALARGDSLQTTLDHCAEVIVRHLDVALAQIWTMREGENLLELHAAAGVGAEMQSADARLPVGALKIARIAEQRQSCVTNNVIGDPEVLDQDWARWKGLVAFAGYPLIVEHRLVGVAAVFARKPLAEDSLKSLASGSDQLASGIERKHAEAALRVSEERFRIAAENGSDIITIWDIPADRVQTSGAIDRMLAPGEQMPHNLAEFQRLLHPDDRDRITAALEHHLQSHEPYRQEYRVIDKDGKVRHWSSRGNAVWNLAGQATQFIVVTTDITAKKRAEAALSHLAAIVESSEASILSIDLDGTVLTWNPAAERIYGYSLHEIKGRSLSVIYPPDLEKELSDLLHMVQQGEATQHFETVRVRKGGETIPVFATYSPLRDPSGKIIGACVITTDITERKLLERQLFQAQKLESIGQLAAGIAHEINTPIQYVSDNTRFLRDSFRKINDVCAAYHELLAVLQRGADPAPLVSKVQACVESARVKYLCAEIPNAIEDSLEGISRVTEIVRAIKEFSHPGSAEKTASDLNHAISSTVLVCRNEWKYVSEVALDLDPELPPVQCLPGEFNQVMLNLIVNAAHAIADALAGKLEQKGKITISTRRRGDWVEIRIKDTGTGIPEAVRPNIFNPFFTTKPVGRGTGQGLSVAHVVIVQKHGGTIDFETEMGVGTTFILRLPIAALSPLIKTNDMNRSEGTPANVGGGELAR